MACEVASKWMSSIAKGRGWCNDARWLAISASLATYPSSERRECYGAIFPIFPSTDNRLQVAPKTECTPESHVAPTTRRDATGIVIMGKVEKMDPVWDNLDR